MSSPGIEFQAELCTCDHPPAAHDDGFGCTEPARYRESEPCPCLAGWSFALFGAAPFITEHDAADQGLW